MAGTESNDRSGLLFYILEAASGGLRFRHFGPDTGDSGIRPIAAVKLANAPTLVKRLVGVAERQVRAAWSTDGEQFSWLPAVHSSPTLGC